jgi:hypothetical protein
MLALIIKRISPAARFRRILSAAITTAASVLVVILLCAGVGLFFFGSARAIPALLRNELLLVEPVTVDLGQLTPNESVATHFSVTNLTSKAVVINGIKSSCVCLSSESTPFTIPPHSSRKLVLSVRPVPAQVGKAYKQNVQLFPNIVGLCPVITVTGKVRASSNQSSVD